MYTHTNTLALITHHMGEGGGRAGVTPHIYLPVIRAESGNN